MPYGYSSNPYPTIKSNLCKILKTVTANKCKIKQSRWKKWGSREGKKRGSGASLSGIEIFHICLIREKMCSERAEIKSQRIEKASLAMSSMYRGLLEREKTLSRVKEGWCFCLIFINIKNCILEHGLFLSSSLWFLLSSRKPVVLEF